MDLQLSGKVAIVTGASRGIGRAIAETLAAEGMRLLLVARSEDSLRTVVDGISAGGGGGATHLSIDLREPDSAHAVVARAIEAFGRLDLLVNNAGATTRGDFLALTEEQWSDGFALKFFGAMRCCRAAWPHLVASGGAIVNISGVGGRTGSAEFAIGGAVNAAVMNLTKVLADRGIKDGVRVNAVNPGGVATERLTSRIELVAKEEGSTFDAAQRKMAEKLGTARFGRPEEIARAVAFLASPAAAYCQGAILDVDGGQTRTL